MLHIKRYEPQEEKLVDNTIDEEEDEVDQQQLDEIETQQQIEESPTKKRTREESSSEDEEQLREVKRIKDDNIKLCDVKKGNTWVMSQSTVDIHKSNLSKSIIKGLEHMKITHLFPVQRAVIPITLSIIYSGVPGDILVGAPTGCGKTLAFVLPILEILSQKTFCKLRAMVIVPTKNLAAQVCSVFWKLVPFISNSGGIKVKLLNGKHSFSKEQKMVVNAYKDENGMIKYQSNADVVIGTPGRIWEHIHNTPGFTLRNLQFLVLDEVDKMLGQSRMSTTIVNIIDNAQQEQKILQQDKLPSPSPFTLMRKLLFSATLTKNPQKLSQLKIFRPQFFTYTPLEKNKKYMLPESLQQYIVAVNDASLKPLYLMRLLKKKKQKKNICFTSSVERAHRLFRLLQLMNIDKIAEFHSNIKMSEQKKILKQFGKGDIRLIVCSDSMARGMDIEVENVINYDSPQHLKTYIHRVGRTARAGKKGYSYTLLEQSEIQDFRSKMSEVECGEITEYFIEDVESDVPKLQQALKDLQQLLNS